MKSARPHLASNADEMCFGADKESFEYGPDLLLKKNRRQFESQVGVNQLNAMTPKST